MTNTIISLTLLSMVTMMVASKKWGGVDKDLCWLDNGTIRFKVPGIGYKKCKPDVCPRNDIGVFPSTNCQICCYYKENEGSCISLVTYKTISWQTIVYIAIPCSIILLYAIGISILFYRKTRNHHRPIICEGSPVSSQDSLNIGYACLPKQTLLTKKGFASGKSNAREGDDQENLLPPQDHPKEIHQDTHSPDTLYSHIQQGSSNDNKSPSGSRKNVVKCDSDIDGETDPLCMNYMMSNTLKNELVTVDLTEVDD